MNSEKKGAAIGKALLSGPYLLWMIGFTLIPLALIMWYGLTDKHGAVTLSNIIAIASADHADVYKRQAHACADTLYLVGSQGDPNARAADCDSQVSLS